MKAKNDAFDIKQQDWFYDRYTAVKIEAKRYFTLTITLSATLALTVIGWIIILPLKQTVTEPYVILVDNVSGITSTLTAAQAEDFKKHTPVVRYFLSKYTQAHDSYSIATAETQYGFVRAFSTPEVFSTFQTEWKDPKLKELMQTLGAQGEIAVEVVSVTFPQPDIAHVRYVQKIMKEGNTLKRSTWLATLKIDQLEEVDEAIAILNPLGLVITHYQRTRESENV